MEKYKYDESNGLWYELQGDYYLPCLQLPEERTGAYRYMGTAAFKLSGKKTSEFFSPACSLAAS